MFNEFKKFLMRGNVVDLAVAVVVGAAFGAVVTSMVENLINPIIGLVGGQDFADLGITLKDAEGADPAVVLGYGAVVSAIINFVLVAGAVFFLIVKPLNSIAERRKRGQAADEDTPAPTDEAVLLAEIRDLLQGQAAPSARATAAKKAPAPARSTAAKKAAKR
jgi:large conductance mechanosensitive channel